jgi:2-iminoacetate synthase ThiH
VFRPPSEADSLILPVTNGCSWNKCTYCEMYTAPQKKFALRDEDETLDPSAAWAAVTAARCSACSWVTATPWRCPPGA